MGLLGLAAAGLLIGGWTVNGWRADSQKLDAAKAAVRDAQNRMVAAQRASAKADDERAEMGMKLSDAEAALLTTSTQAKVIIRRVVQIDPRCDLEPSVIRVLNAARRGEGLSPTTDPTPKPSGTIAAAP